jgi:hypothetical protein
MVNRKKVIYSIIGSLEVIILAIFIFLEMFTELALLIPIICFTVLIAGLIEFRRESAATSQVSDTSETISYEEADGLPEDKIRCPHCNKEIPEGLTFCPECGERIPPEGLFNS